MSAAVFVILFNTQLNIEGFRIPWKESFWTLRNIILKALLRCWSQLTINRKSSIKKYHDSAGGKETPIKAKQKFRRWSDMIGRHSIKNVGCFITGKKEFLFNWFRLFSGKGITNYSKIYDLLRFVGVFSMTKFAQRHFRDRISGRWQLFIRNKWFVLFSSEWLALLEVIIYFLNKQSNYDKKNVFFYFFICHGYFHRVRVAP